SAQIGRRVIIHDFVDVVDCKTVKFYNFFFDTITTSNRENIILIDEDLFYIKSISDKTIKNYNCDEDSIFYTNIIDNHAMSVYGYGVDSYSLYHYLLTENKAKYEELDSMSIKSTGLNFYESYFYGLICKHKNITDFLLNEFSF